MSFTLLGILNSQASGGISYWLTEVGDSLADFANGVALDSQNNAYQIGHSNLGPSTTNFALKKYDPDGTIQWQRVLGEAGRDAGYGVAIDSADNIYVVGDSKTNYFGVFHFLIAKYNSSGTIQWQRRLFGAADDNARGVAIDSNDNVYVVGKTSSEGAGSGDILLAKYNSSGTIQWQRILGYSNFDMGNGVAIDSNDNVYVVGRAQQPAGGGDNFLVAKYNSSGTIQWQRSLGGSQAEIANGVAIDSSDNVYVFGQALNTGAGALDFLLAKYNSAGTYQWQRTLGQAGNDEGTSVAIDSSDNVYVLGQYAPFNQYYYGMSFAKYDSSGTIQWQRRLDDNSSTSGVYGSSVAIDSLDNVYVNGRIELNSQALLVKLPNDGSLTGTYVLNGITYIYAASSLTGATSTLASTTGTLTSATSTLTAETSAATGQTVSQTQYLLEI